MRLPLVLLALTLVACGEEDADELPCDVGSGTLSGTIDGESWTFVAGQTDSYLSDDEEFFAELYAEDYEACSWSAPEGSHLLVSIPTTPGEYEFGAMMNGTFVYDDGGSPMNEVSFSGVVVVDEVTETEVIGALCMAVGDHEVAGEFVLDICAE
jgi:hypothetical protein